MMEYVIVILAGPDKIVIYPLAKKIAMVWFYFTLGHGVCMDKHVCKCNEGYRGSFCNEKFIFGHGKVIDNE